MVHGHTNIQPRRSYVATLPLSRSKGQGYQAALPSAALTCKAAAAVSVGTYSAWESTSTLRLLCGARGACAPTGRRGAGAYCVATRTACFQRIQPTRATTGNYMFQVASYMIYMWSVLTELCTLWMLLIYFIICFGKIIRDILKLGYVKSVSQLHTAPCVFPGCKRIDPLRFLTGCRKRRSYHCRLYLSILFIYLFIYLTKLIKVA